MRALVTGAGGFVGTHLVNYLRANGDEVIAAVLEDPNQATGAQVSETVRLDICDPHCCRRVIVEYNPHVIYHLAAISFVPEAEKNRNLTFNTNVNGTHNILEAAQNLEPTPRFVFVSTSEVYGGAANNLGGGPLSEEVSPVPLNYYSLSKLMSETVVNYYARRWKIPAVIFRPFNHIGAGQDSRFVVPAFASQLAAIKNGEQEPRIKVGNLDSKRDFLDVEDVVEAYRLAGASEHCGIYNLCSEKAVAIADILTMLLEISDLDVAVEKDPERMRPSEVPCFFGSSRKAREELGWQPGIELRDSLTKVYNYWLGK